MDIDDFTVVVTAELAPLVTAFIDHRRSDLRRLRQGIAAEDFTDLEKLGHNLIGPSGALGFGQLVKIGQDIEAAARQRDLLTLTTIAERFDHFMSHHKIV